MRHSLWRGLAIVFIALAVTARAAQTPARPCRGCRCPTTRAFSSPPMGARSSGSATRRGSSSTGSTARTPSATCRTARARLHGDPGGRARGVRRPGRRRTRTATRRCATTIPRSRTRRTSRTSTGSSASANALGLYVGFLPTWGDKWNKKRGVGPEIFTPENAEQYGEWLGRRYKDDGVDLDPRRRSAGRDRRARGDHRARWRAGCARATAARTSSRSTRPAARDPPTWFHDDAWLDFNMRQNGHGAEFTGRYDQTRVDYDAHADQAGARRRADLRGPSGRRSTPTKFGHSIAGDVRRAAVLGPVQRRLRPHLRPSLGVADVDAGADADQQSAAAMDGGDRRSPAQRRCSTRRALIESRPFLTRVPDRRRHRRRSRADERTRRRALPRSSRRATPPALRDGLRTGRPDVPRPHARHRRPRVSAWWFNPRTGTATAIGTFTNEGERAFTPPDRGEMLDWVLVLDDESKKYPPPGTRQ